LTLKFQANRIAFVRQNFLFTYHIALTTCFENNF